MQVAKRIYVTVFFLFSPDSGFIQQAEEHQLLEIALQLLLLDI